MNQTEKEKINRFLNDVVMSKAVYDVLLKAFLKKKDGDVQKLAASRIAIDLLQDAWNDLQKLKMEEEREKNIIKQVGM